MATRYNKYYYCRGGRHWLQKNEAKLAINNSPYCPYCKYKVSAKPRKKESKQNILLEKSLIK